MIHPPRGLTDEHVTVYCPRCDAATTRSAQLVQALKRTAQALHEARGHFARWPDCQNPDCQHLWRLTSSV